MLHSVAGPAGILLVVFRNTRAGHGRDCHQIGASLVIVRFPDGYGAVFFQRAQDGFRDAVGKGSVLEK